MAFEIRYSQQPLNHPSHTHVYYELLYVLEGEVAMTIRGREHRVEAGSLVFLSPFDADVYKRQPPGPLRRRRRAGCPPGGRSSSGNYGRRHW